MILKKKKVFYKFIIVSILAFISCSKDNEVDLNSAEKERIISFTTSDTIIRITVDGHDIPVYLSLPRDCDEETFPAVVTLHGSNGLWSDTDSGKGLSRQFKDWQQVFAQNCVVGAFVDSYTPRGVTTRTGKFRNLPDNIPISAQYVRPRDANATLKFLQNLKSPNGKPLIDENRIGLLGFSDGASATMASLIDLDRVPENFEWTQSQDGRTYNLSDGVLPPQPKPENAFTGGVFYYGGSVGYNYWGKHPCGSDAMENNVFYPYAPMLFHIPSDDNLTENTLCMIEVLQRKGAPIEMQFYPNASHGFDTDNLSSSRNAREKTISWFKNQWSK